MRTSSSKHGRAGRIQNALTMAQNRLLAVTDRQRIRPLTLQGQPVIDSRPQIASRLTSGLSEAHAALFAEPSRDDAHARIEWYTSAPGPLRRLQDLEPPQQEQARAELGRLIADIEGLVGELRELRDPGERLLGELIALALQGPGDEHVFVVGEQPIIAAWGMTQLGSPSAQPLLTRYVAVRPAPSSPDRPATVAARVEPIRVLANMRPKATAPPAAGPVLPSIGAAWPWLLPLAGSLALLVLLAALLPLWAPPVLAVLAPPRTLYEIPATQHRDLAILDDKVTEEAQLRRRLAELQAMIAGRRADCQNPSSQANTTITERLQRERAGRGEVQVTLSWNGGIDLDLFVRCPNGDVISHQKRAACGGQLDVDMNCRGMSCRRADNPIENIFWSSAAPPGRYDIFVSNYDNGPSVEFVVRVLVHGEERTFRGSAAQREPAVIGGFTVP